MRPMCSAKSQDSKRLLNLGSHAGNTAFRVVRDVDRIGSRPVPACIWISNIPTSRKETAIFVSHNRSPNKGGISL